MSTTTDSAMAKIDAMAGFLAALDSLGEPFVAVGKLACTAVELRRWGVTMKLDLQNLTREEYDASDGEETYFAPTPERAHPFWTKTVTLWQGEGYDQARGVEGNVLLTLYTRQPPVNEDEDDPNEGLDFDPTLYGNGASQEPTQRV